MKISIVIPAYNEEKRIGKSLETIISYMNDNHSDYEILVVDDGSSDKTNELVSGFDKVTFFQQEKNMGKGAAVRRGMLEAKGDILVFSDADLSTPIYELKKVLSGIEEGYDIVIGSRALQNELVKKHQPWYRETMGKTFNKIVQFLVFSGIKDTQCGFKGFKKHAAKNIFAKARIDGFAFDVEVLYLASKLGYKVKEVPVEWYNDERSTVHPIIDSIKMILEILKIRNLH